VNDQVTGSSDFRGIADGTRVALIPDAVPSPSTIFDDVTRQVSAGTRAALAVRRASDSGVRLKSSSWQRWASKAVGTHVGGRYRVQGVLAGGGMGVVLRCQDTVTGMPVALKVIRPDATDDDLHERFEREVQAARLVRSPHVAEVYDWGVDARVGSYLAMELVAGTTLFDAVRKRGALSPDYVVGIGLQLVKALRATHEAGVVHRDLKPPNVQLGVRDGVLRTVLLDFGICRMTGERELPALTAPGMLIGTLRFMAPEQLLQPERIGPHTDVWGLGALLYFALTGSRPYEGELTPRQVCEAMIQGPPTPPHELRSEVPRSLSEVVQKAMASQIRNRPDLAELEKLLRAVDTRPPRRLRKPRGDSVTVAYDLLEDSGEFRPLGDAERADASGVERRRDGASAKKPDLPSASRDGAPAKKPHAPSTSRDGASAKKPDAPRASGEGASPIPDDAVLEEDRSPSDRLVLQGASLVAEQPARPRAPSLDIQPDAPRPRFAARVLRGGLLLAASATAAAASYLWLAT